VSAEAGMRNSTENSCGIKVGLVTSPGISGILWGLVYQQDLCGLRIQKENSPPTNSRLAGGLFDFLSMA